MHNYILHPSNMRNRDAELNLRIEEGAKGYGIYMMILELLRDAANYRIANNTKMIAFALNHNVIEDIERVINNYSLFEISEDGFISSRWLCESLAEMNAKREKLSEAGKRGARARQARAKNDANDETQGADNQQTNFAPPHHEAEDENKPPFSHPSATLEGGSSILTNKLINKQINESIKETLICDGGEVVSVEWLKKLLKNPSIDDIDRYRSLKNHDDNIERNFKILARLEEDFELSLYDRLFFNAVTNFCAVGGKNLVCILKIERKMREEQFKPRFWGNYILKKLLES